MRSGILGWLMVAVLLPGAAGASDGAPAAAGVFLVQADPAQPPLALVIVNEHDAVVVVAQGAVPADVVDRIRGITAKPVSVVAGLPGLGDAAGHDAVYRREFPDAKFVAPREELTLFRGDRTIHLMRPDGSGAGEDLVVWLPDEGIVVNRALEAAPTR